MRQILCAGVSGLLIALVASAASGQVAGSVNDRSVYLLGKVNPGYLYGGSGSVGDGSYQFDLAPGENDAHLNYQLASQFGPDYVAFANNATLSGYSSRVETSTSIGVTYTNNTGSAFNATLTSTITPAGAGFYVADPTGNFEAPNDINHHPQSTGYTFDSLPLAGLSRIEDISINGVTHAGVQVLGRAEIGFSVWLGDEGSGALLRNYDFASTALKENDQLFQTNGHVSFFLEDMGMNLASSLRNFGLEGSGDPAGAWGYRWDNTDFDTNLGVVAAGDTVKVTYVTSLRMWAGKESQSPNVSLLTYAGFGDPIGHGGGGGAIEDPFFPLLKLGGLNFDVDANGNAHGTVGDYLGTTGSPLALQNVTGPFVYNEGGPFGPFPEPQSASAPEPGAWALMLAGFSILGAALRRRRPAVAPLV